MAPGARAPTPRQLLAALGDPRTFTPPALRSPSTVKPPQTPRLRVPDDIPTIELHGPELTIMVHDDPFETALAQIYQVGLREQCERLNRLEAFDAKASDMRSAHMQTAAQRCAKGSGRRHPQATRRQHGGPAAADGHRRDSRSNWPSGDAGATRDAATSSDEQLRRAPPAGPRPRLAGTHTFVAPSSRRSMEVAMPPPGVGDLRNLKDVASASLQDVTLERRGMHRMSTASAVGGDRSLPSSPSLATAASDTNGCDSGDDDDDASADTFEAEIHAAFQRLMKV
ncbi:Protein SABRE, partial [Coemansia spiralis]